MLAKKRILIVGAGPTGLTLSNTLKKFSIDYDIVDAKKMLSSTSKGLSINVSSQIVFSMLGIGGKVGSQGKHIQKLCLFFNTEKIMRCNLDYLNHYRYLITQSQATTERELYECLEEKNNEIQWETKLESIVITGNRYTARLEFGDGKVKMVDYDYIIGCEGKNSIVRDTMGSGLSGIDYPMYFLLGDFSVDEDISPDEAKYIHFDDNFFIIIPFGVKKYRVVIISNKKVSAHNDISDLLKNIVNRYYKTKFIKLKANWTSSAEIYLRVADKLRNNGLFICGDAGHLVSPIGGTGMNMGIQDSFNLGCKLASVMKGFQSEDVLNRYEPERLAVINATCKMIDATTKMIFDKDFREKNYHIFKPGMSKRKTMRNETPLAYSGLAIRYPHNVSKVIDNQYAENLFGSLYTVMQILYERKVIADIKPTLIFTLSKDFDVTSFNSDSVSTFTNIIDNLYCKLFNQLYFNYDGVKITNENITNVKSIDSELPVCTIFLINMEGFIEYGCKLDDVNNMQTYIQGNYLEQGN